METSFGFWDVMPSSNVKSKKSILWELAGSLFM
jgi:hypothetical protein